MVQHHEEANNRRVLVFRRARKAWACTALVPIALLVALAGQRYMAMAQQLTGLDTQAQSNAIIAHLNSVIGFYRSTSQPIQKAGEPNDVVYRDQALSAATQIAQLAFQSAKAQAELMGASASHAAPAAAASISSTQQRMQASQANVEQRISDLEARLGALDKQIATAKPSAVPALEAQKKQLHDALDLANAMKDALGRIVAMSASAGSTALAANITRLEDSVPELHSANKTSTPQLTTIQSALSAGVTSQGTVLFQLLEARHSLAMLEQENDRLDRQVLALRSPLGAILRGLIQQGQQLSSQAEQAPPPPPARHAGHAAPITPQAATPPPVDLQSITRQFKAITAATVPLSQEIIVLESSRANLVAWETSLDREYSSILHALLLRVFVIAVALLIILAGGEIWTKAANKYVRDIRRRRQLLIVRRVVVGFLSGIVVLFGFVTQFHSLATFAGFITAGIAVGLQTILLSVAAYFFIIGRYGIKVGDRITIASVTGDVIDVGLVRFYVMELAGAGVELNPTGRVAVFSNAVLFQAGTPLYKQLPGSGYQWHELTVKLADAADYRKVCDSLLQAVHSVYDEYRQNIEQQHRLVQNWMQATIDPPEIQSRLQFSGGAFQLWIRYPVEIGHAGAIDEKVTSTLLERMAADPAIKAAVAATPSIQPSVRG